MELKPALGRPIDVPRLASIVLIVLATAGCVGPGAGSKTGPSSDHNASSWPRTVLTITYYAQRCPPGARCLGQVKSQGNRKFVRVVRNLHCNPAGGNYMSPAAACRALPKVVQRLKRRQYCPCVSPVHPGDKAAGVYQGKRRTIPLDLCSLCNLQLNPQLAVLLPGAAG